MASIMAFINPKTSTPLKKFDASSLHKKEALKALYHRQLMLPGEIEYPLRNQSRKHKGYSQN